MEFEPVKTSGDGLANKLDDLAILLEAYQNYIDGRYIDPDDYLDWLCSRCDLGDYLTGAQVWIDGFAGFTPQQYEVIRSLVIHSDQVTISLCLDPASRQFALAQTPDGRLNELDVFYPVLDTCQRLMNLAEECACPVGAPYCLPMGKVMPRFKEAPGILQIEKRFLTGQAGNPEGNCPDDVHLIATASQRDEVNAVAYQILALCREKGYRYGEIAVILRSLEGYQELIETVFKEHGIPFFCDVRRGVGHHPMIKLVRAAPAILGDDFRLEHMMDYLKSDLAPVSREEADRLENYCLAHDIRGGLWMRDEVWSQEASIDAIRRQALGPLLRLSREFARLRHESGLTACAISTGLVHFFFDLDIPNRLSQWCQEDEKQGILDRAQIHRQIYRQLMDVFDELVEALGEQPMDVTEYADILGSALSQMTLPLIPPAIDQVLVGAIERSRQPFIRAAFVLGVNEGHFPLRIKPTGLFTDQQRNRFVLDHFEMAAPDAERLIRERYLGYIAFTRPSEYLWVSYPLADRGGQLLTPSPFIGELCQCVDGGRIVSLPDSRSQADPDRIAIKGHLTVQLAGALAECHGGGNQTISPIWSELYRQSKVSKSLAPILTSSLAGVTWQNQAVLDAEIAALVRSDRTTMSVTQLESFAACPFQYYCHYNLGLKERELLTLKPIDLGRLYHAILEETYHALKRQDSNWKDYNPDEFPALIARVASQLKQDDPQLAGLLTQSARNRFLFDMAVTQITRLCGSLAEMARAGRFEQCYAELYFGEQGVLPPLSLSLNDQIELRLSGLIDRVDSYQPEGLPPAFVVYDFKSSRSDWDIARFYYGLEIQLMTYLLVLLQSGIPGLKRACRPAGALYMPINRKGKSHNSSPPDEVLDAAGTPTPARHKAKGIINSSYVSVLDTLSSGASFYYDFYIKKDGTPGKTTSVVSEDHLAAMVGYCRQMLEKLGQGIADGNIEIKPYRYREQHTPCTWCHYRGVCRFDPAIDTYRHLPTVDRETLLERMGHEEVFGG